MDSSKRPAKGRLSTQQHAAFRENADLVVFMPPAWADNTKLNFTSILKKWKAYCQDMKLGHSALRTAQKGTSVMSFLLYLCGNHDIKSSGTCWQYFRRWKQLYAKTGRAVLGDQRQQRSAQVLQESLDPLKSPTLRTKNVRDSGDLLGLLLQLCLRPPHLPQRTPASRRRSLLPYDSLHGMPARRGRRWRGRLLGGALWLPSYPPVEGTRDVALHIFTVYHPMYLSLISVMSSPYETHSSHQRYEYHKSCPHLIFGHSEI
ncbi:hypothetical protein EDB84DRAFT_1654857 [Lactarius hengduanensis]|nr:hypothetical protein EDB84DRAFT_1654857 [Lactarius hengduanensis]